MIIDFKTPSHYLSHNVELTLKSTINHKFSERYYRELYSESLGKNWWERSLPNIVPLGSLIISNNSILLVISDVKYQMIKFDHDVRYSPVTSYSYGLYVDVLCNEKRQTILLNNIDKIVQIKP